MLVNGATVTMNRALRDSHLIDSDQDGIPNYVDEFPLGGSGSAGSGGGSGVLPSLVNPGNGTRTFSITWTAMPNAVYQIDYRTNLAVGQWQFLTLFTNTQGIARSVMVSDVNIPANAPQRFYRLGLRP